MIDHFAYKGASSSPCLTTGRGIHALAFIFLLFLSLPFSLLSAQSPDPLADFPNRVRKITLKNGLRALIVERPNSPTVSFAMYIRTGGLDDKAGKSGLAHMFEHMLFKGTKTIGTNNFTKESKILNEIDRAHEALQKELDKRQPDPERLKEQRAKIESLEKAHEELIEPEEFWKIYERAGAADMNASTGFDFTNYQISLPSNKIKLWMAMESDRIKNPVLREFYRERSVVLEERRMRVESSPQGKLWEGFLTTAFAAHPYGRPLIGWADDIVRLTRTDAEQFFKSHYDISRLVVAVVGGVDADLVESLLRSYFEPLPTYPLKAEGYVTPEPPQQGERRVFVEYDAEPSLLIGYHRPDMKHEDGPALDVVADLLSQGRTSRFYRHIIQKSRIGVSAWAGSSTPGERDPNLFVMGGTPRSPHTAQELEAAFYEQIEKLRTEGPAPEELEKVKNNRETSLIRDLSSNIGLANQLAYYEAVGGNWKFLLDNILEIRNVTAADVKRVIGTYLVPSNRTVGILVRKK